MNYVNVSRHQGQHLGSCKVAAGQAGRTWKELLDVDLDPGPSLVVLDELLDLDGSGFSPV